MSFERPLLLVLLILALLPLLLRPERPSAHPALGLTPPDRLSRWVSAGLRLAGVGAIATLVVALAGPFSGGGSVTRQGQGANIVLLIDRSSSMDNSFAGRAPDGAEDSKSAVAKRLLVDFASRRPHDRIGVAAFSTSPMEVLPITDHLDAVRGAIAAIDRPGLAHTDVGRGLAMAFGQFGPEMGGEARAVVLVSDGAGVIGMEVQDLLRQQVAREPVNLYWLFIRTKGSPGIFETPASKSDDTPQARPERHLHLFLGRLGIPYRAFEAESPEAIAEAIGEIDRLETRPIAYVEELPRQPLAWAFYAVAAVLLAALLAARLAERPLVPAGPPLPALKRREGRP